METTARPDGLWTLSALMEHEPNPADPIWHGSVLAAGAPTAIVGAPGVGKSRLSLQASVAPRSSSTTAEPEPPKPPRCSATTAPRSPETRKSSTAGSAPRSTWPPPASTTQASSSSAAPRSPTAPSWPPFAARLNERHMRYEVLPDFDLDEWAEGMGSSSPGRRKKSVYPRGCRCLCHRARREERLWVGVNSPHGLVQRIMKEFKVGRPASEEAVRMRSGETIQYIDRPAPNGRQGKRVFLLKK
jgi:hypothetical protein